MKRTRAAFSSGVLLLALLVPAPASGATPIERHSQAVSVSSVAAFDTDLPKGSVRQAQSPTPRAQRYATAASWVCTVYSSDPRKSGIFLEGDGSQFCSGAGFAATKITVKVQRSRWYGWQTVRTQITSWSSASFRELVDVAYDCSGDGTYTYRIVTTGYANGVTYSQSVQSLNYLRVSC